LQESKYCKDGMQIAAFLYACCAYGGEFNGIVWYEPPKQLWRNGLYWQSVLSENEATHHEKQCMSSSPSPACWQNKRRHHYSMNCFSPLKSFEIFPASNHCLNVQQTTSSGHTRSQNRMFSLTIEIRSFES